MPNSILVFTAIALYAIATAFTALHLRANKGAEEAGSKIRLAFAVAGLAALAHIAHILNVSFTGQAINLSLSSMITLVSGLLTVTFLLGGLAMPIRRLGVLVYPLTIFSLIFSCFWGDTVTVSNNRSTAFSAHIIVSLFAYSLLAIAAIQALLYVYQERQIKNRTNPAMLIALPPLQTMEILLFRLVSFGFAALSLTLITGAVFSQEIFGHAFEFKHHTILASLGWLAFAILLYKRIRHGLRGSQAVAWTIGGFLLIQLGYFGTKIVSESLAVQ